MKFFTKKLKNNNFEDEYIEVLIELIRLNTDRSWDSVFKDIRKYRGLPGGGAGSLNDWGPQYSGSFEDPWYSSLYEIIRFLFDEKLKPEKVNEYHKVKDWDKILIIECLKCKKSRQHPRVFERQIANKFYYDHLTNILEKNDWQNLFKKSLTWNSDYSARYRNELKEAYLKKQIWVGTTDKINPMLKCNNCEKKYNFDHVYYRVSQDSNHIKLQFMKRA